VREDFDDYPYFSFDFKKIRDYSQNPQRELWNEEMSDWEDETMLDYLWLLRQEVEDASSKEMLLWLEGKYGEGVDYGDVKRLKAETIESVNSQLNKWDKLGTQHNAKFNSQHRIESLHRNVDNITDKKAKLIFLKDELKKVDLKIAQVKELNDEYQILYYGIIRKAILIQHHEHETTREDETQNEATIKRPELPEYLKGIITDEEYSSLEVEEHNVLIKIMTKPRYTKLRPSLSEKENRERKAKIYLRFLTLSQHKELPQRTILER